MTDAMRIWFRKEKKSNGQVCKIVGAYIEGQSSMDAVMLNSKSKYEAPKNKGNDIIHVGVSNLISRSDSEEGEEEERRHGGDGHRHSFSNPPGEHPGKNTHHVRAGHRAIELYKKADEGAEERPQQDEEALGRENGQETCPIWGLQSDVLNRKQWSFRVIGYPIDYMLTAHFAKKDGEARRRRRRRWRWCKNFTVRWGLRWLWFLKMDEEIICSFAFFSMGSLDTI